MPVTITDDVLAAAHLSEPELRRELAVALFREERLTLGHGQLTVAYNRGLNSAKVDVLHIGDDTAAEIRRATQDLFEVTGAEAVYLHLPLGDPATPGLLDAAEAEGYFFSALGPSFLPTGDALCLQRLAADLDFSQIEIANPFASELLGYISDDRDRVRAAQVS